MTQRRPEVSAGVPTGVPTSVPTAGPAAGPAAASHEPPHGTAPEASPGRRPPRPPSLGIATAALVALIGCSIALALAPAVGASHGYVLAGVKVAVLGFLLKRVLQVHVYTLQWSSMLILLFIAEGTVRAMSDPPPQAVLGTLEAMAATVFFVVVLRFLRPLKKAAARPKR